MKQILLYDTTLRDGMQGETIFFSLQDKLQIARKLDDTGIHYIEGGWPGSNPATDYFFQMLKKETFSQAQIVAFGSTRRQNQLCEDDTNLRALINSGAAIVAIFGKSWDFHVCEIMSNTREENLAMIQESVNYLVGHGRQVFYDAEHFFDGYKANPDFAIETLEAAVAGEAKILVLCDTNGGSMPFEIEYITKKVVVHFKNRPEIHIGIHTHNDCAMAVANTVTAVKAGATIVQGTINGYGERCGNADLTAIIPILSLKMKRKCISKNNLCKMLKLSRFVSETANMPPVSSRPFVGKSAFAHKGGVHVSAIIRNPIGYEHIDPKEVGNERRILVSEQSGKSNIRLKAREFGVSFDDDLKQQQVVSTIKDLEEYGYAFDVAEASLKLIMEKIGEQFKSYFELESFRVVVEKNKEKPCYSYAMIKIRVGNKTKITSAEGDGPVSALDNAIRKVLAAIYPQLEEFRLVDFKIRVIEGSNGTGSKVRVLIESRDSRNIFSTIGVSHNIIEASWQALADSFQYKLSIDALENVNKMEI